jgi:HPt (histidine-containing phosphotransfer) domain-containing protein
MSAHAMAEEQAKSLAAGMDEHLVKPVDANALYRVLARLRRGDPRAAVAACGERADAAASDDDDQEIRRRLSRRFAGGAEAELDALRAALAADDAAAAMQRAHAIAGVALNLGLDAVGHAARDLELALAVPGAPSDGLQRQMAALRRALDLALTEIDALAQDDGTTLAAWPVPAPAPDGSWAPSAAVVQRAAGPALAPMAGALAPAGTAATGDSQRFDDDPQWRRRCDELAELLACNNLRAREAYDALRTDLGAQPTAVALLQALTPVGRHVERLEFAAAGAALAAARARLAAGS